MIYPIKIKPAPRVVSGEHKGATITHLGVGERGLEIYTPDTVIKGSEDILPQSLRRIMGNVLKQARGRPGPFIVVPDEIAEDVTYDTESAAPPKDKPEPEEVSFTHPKERKLKQELGMEPPETETPLEMPKYEKFPPSLPSEHPKEKALERQMAEGSKTSTDKPMFKKGKLDLTPFLLREVGGQMFARKADAVKFAKKKGWRIQDVTAAFNRFNEFWIVGQQIDSNTFRVLGPKGHVDLKFGG